MPLGKQIVHLLETPPTTIVELDKLKAAVVLEPGDDILTDPVPKVENIRASASY